MRAFSSAASVTDLPLANPENLPRLDRDKPRPAYRIGPQDELTITVWGSKDIWSEISAQGQQNAQTTVVRDDGTIVLPLLKNVQVDGLTLTEALTKIADLFKAVVGGTFQVEGQLTKFRSKSILLDGAFHKPGIVYLSTELSTLGEAISGSGGGLPEAADVARGVMIRGGNRYIINYQDAQEGANDLQDILLQAGDRIFFPSRNSGFFYVLGEVNLPGAFPIPPKGITLVQGIAQARGPSMATANMESIFLIRTDEKEPKIYRLTLGEIMASKDFPIVSGDRLFVPPTGLTNFDRQLRQIFPFISSTIVIKGGFGISLPLP